MQMMMTIAGRQAQVHALTATGTVDRLRSERYLNMTIVFHDILEDGQLVSRGDVVLAKPGEGPSHPKCVK